MKPSTNKADEDFLPEATDELITEYRNRFRVMTNSVVEGCLAHAAGRYYDGRDYHVLSQAQAQQLTNMIRILLKRVDADKIVIAKQADLLQEKSIPDEEEKSDPEKIELLEVQLREAKDRNLILHQKITKMAAIQAEMSERVDLYQHEAVIRENNQLMAKTSFLENKLSQISEEKTDNCQKQIKFYLAEIDKLSDSLNELKTLSQRVVVENENFIARVDHAKLFVKVLLGIYPDVDPYYVRNIMRELISQE